MVIPILIIKVEQEEKAKSLLQRLPSQYPNSIEAWSTVWMRLAQHANFMELVDTTTLILDTLSSNLAEGKLDTFPTETREWMETQIQQLRQ
ncbi:MAG: hypothetical protein AAFZ63_26010 [Bacteroidota bacterium]